MSKEMTQEEVKNLLCNLFICPSIRESVSDDKKIEEKKPLVYTGNSVEDKAVEFLKYYDEWSDEEEKNFKKKDFHEIIRIANRIRKHQLAELKCKEIEDEYIEFDGQNCDECEGWDGFSRRCQCGNRRVDWEYRTVYDGQLFLLNDEEGIGYLYGEAY